MRFLLPLCLLIATDAPAATLWVHSTSGVIALIDTHDSGFYQEVGSFGRQLNDIGFAPDGTLWGLSGGALWEIDPWDPRNGSEEGPTGIGGNALVFHPDGRAFVGRTGGNGITGWTYELVAVDMMSGEATTVLEAPGYSPAGDLAFTADGKLYGTTWEGPLVGFDVEEATWEVVGDTGRSALWGLAFDPSTGTLYATDADTRKLLTIDPANAAMTVVHDAKLNQIGGTAFFREAGADGYEPIVDPESEPLRFLSCGVGGDLWPPNHQMVAVEVLFQSSGYHPATAGAFIVTSSEADDAKGNGDGDTIGDIHDIPNADPNAAPNQIEVPIIDPVAGSQWLDLRAERGGTQDGRCYEVEVTLQNDEGEEASCDARRICVGHDQAW